MLTQLLGCDNDFSMSCSAGALVRHKRLPFIKESIDWSSRILRSDFKGVVARLCLSCVNMVAPACHMQIRMSSTVPDRRRAARPLSLAPLTFAHRRRRRWASDCTRRAGRYGAHHEISTPTRIRNADIKMLETCVRKASRTENNERGAREAVERHAPSPTVHLSMESC